MPATRAKSAFGIHFTHFTGLTTSRSCGHLALAAWNTSSWELKSGKSCRLGCSIRTVAQMTIGLQPAGDLAALLTLADWLQAQGL